MKSPRHASASEDPLRHGPDLESPVLIGGYSQTPQDGSKELSSTAEHA
jgi:hypothetical protein